MCILNIGSNALASGKDNIMASKQINITVKTTVNDLSKNMNLNGTILVGKKDETIYTQHFGFADIAANIPVSTDTQYFVGSVTKQFAAVALLKALLDINIQNGIDKNDVNSLKNSIQVDLNRPVAYYLSSENSIWAGAMPEWANIVTVHQLLTHTSGIVDCSRLPNYNDLMKNPPNVVELIELFKDKDLEFKPGSRFSYSNSGYILIGLIIEQITEKKLDIYMETAFFKPLTMNATYFITHGTLHDVKKDMKRFSNLARGYYFDVSAVKPTMDEVAQYEPMQIVLASGSLISTAPDLLCWNNALYSGKIIPPFLVDMMVQPFISTGTTNIAYGYGVMIMKPGTEGAYYSHGGLTPGYITNLTYIPTSYLSIISLTNVMFNWDKLMPEIERLKSEQPIDLSDSEQWARVHQIINDRYPSIKNFDLMIIDKAIVEKFE
jgi:CubicO group peptidase (beta-lactamase class C family)